MAKRRWTAKAAMARTEKRILAIEKMVGAISYDWWNDDAGIETKCNEVMELLNEVRQHCEENLSPDIPRDRGGDRIYDDMG
jgi:hypothetical protein